MPLVARRSGNHWATKNHITTISIHFFPFRAGRPQHCRGGRALLRGEDARQFLDGPGQVVQAAVGVACRQLGLAVPGQLLKGPQVDARPAAQRQVGVPQRVEVREQRAVRPRLRPAVFSTEPQTRLCPRHNRPARLHAGPRCPRGTARRPRSARQAVRVLWLSCHLPQR